MKRLLFFWLLFSVAAVNAQERLESRVHTIGGFGLSNEFIGCMQMGAGVNINRLYISGTMTAFMERNRPAMFQSNIGYIIGKEFSVVPYAGYAYEPRIRTDKDEVISARDNMGYGIMALYQLPNSNVSAYLDVNMVGIKSSGFQMMPVIGLKARLGSGECD